MELKTRQVFMAYHGLNQNSLNLRVMRGAVIRIQRYRKKFLVSAAEVAIAKKQNDTINIEGKLFTIKFNILNSYLMLTHEVEGSDILALQGRGIAEVTIGEQVKDRSHVTDKLGSEIIITKLNSEALNELL